MDCCLAKDSEDMRGLFFKAEVKPKEEGFFWDSSKVESIETDERIAFVQSLRGASLFSASYVSHDAKAMLEDPEMARAFSDDDASDSSEESKRRFELAETVLSGKFAFEPGLLWVPIVKDVFEASNPWCTHVALRAMARIANGGSDVGWRDSTLPIRVYGQIVKDVLDSATNNQRPDGFSAARFLDVCRSWVLLTNDVFALQVNATVHEAEPACGSWTAIAAMLAWHRSTSYC